jgi:hypothetical protein
VNIHPWHVKFTAGKVKVNRRKNQQYVFKNLNLCVTHSQDEAWKKRQKQKEGWKHTLYALKFKGNKCFIMVKIVISYFADTNLMIRSEQDYWIWQSKIQSNGDYLVEWLGSKTGKILGSGYSSVVECLSTGTKPCIQYHHYRFFLSW